VLFDPVFADAERMALSGFLAGYSGLTRDAYALDLRQFVAWCDNHKLNLFDVHRTDIEHFGCWLEDRGRARATVARRLCTVAGFYRYAVEEGLLAHSPAVHVRRPRIDYESHATGLDRNEVGALLVAAGLGGAADHALISLLALNGLRVWRSALPSTGSVSSADTEPSPSCAKAARSSPSPSHPVPPGPSTWLSANGWRDRSSFDLTANDSTDTPPAA